MFRSVMRKRSNHALQQNACIEEVTALLVQVLKFLLLSLHKVMCTLGMVFNCKGDK